MEYLIGAGVVIAYVVIGGIFHKMSDPCLHPVTTILAWPFMLIGYFCFLAVEMVDVITKKLVGGARGDR